MVTATSAKERGRKLALRLNLETAERMRPHIHYINCYDHYRLWCSWNFGDQFEVIPTDEFEEKYLNFVRRFPFIFCEGFPENNVGETVCPLCKAQRGELGNTPTDRALDAVQALAKDKDHD